MRDRSTTTLLLLAMAWASACRPADVGEPLNVVLITVDTLRADHLGTYGYFRDTSPHIDRFADDALVVEHAVAPMATTLPSHVSMMTGVYPARHGIVSNYRFFLQTWESNGELRTAAEMLRDAGWATAAFTSSSPLSAETGIGLGFATFESPPVISWEKGRIDQPAEQAIHAAIRWLEASRQEPFFLWVHVFDPHDPYLPPPPFRRTFADQPELFERLDRLAFAREHRRQAADWMNPYDGEIRYVDQQVGRLFAKLAELGLYDRSAIVLAGDHGESLMQHGEARHGGTWDEQLRVPLIFRFPDGPRGRLDKLASLIDVLPTLAGRGIPLDRTQFDGIDLLRERRDYALAQHEVRRRSPQPRLTLSDREWKYWYFADLPDRLYHLASDPHETRDVVGEHPEVAERMRAEVLRLLEDNRRRAPQPMEHAVPEAIRKQLRALGYVD